MTTAEEGALVLFSGGQDSATCLAWALRRFARVETVGFAYGQRHRVELDCAERFRTRYAIPVERLVGRRGHRADGRARRARGFCDRFEHPDHPMAAERLL